MTARSSNAKPTATAKKPSALVLAQDQPTLDRINQGLRDSFELRLVSNLQQLRDSLRRQPVDLLLVETHLVDADLPELLGDTGTRFPKIPVILLTSLSEVDYALDTIGLGRPTTCASPLPWASCAIPWAARWSISGCAGRWRPCARARPAAWPPSSPGTS